MISSGLSRKSRLTPLAISTTWKWWKREGGGRPRMSARKAAEAPASRAWTMVWLSSTLMTGSMGSTAAAVDRMSRGEPSGFGPPQALRALDQLDLVAVRVFHEGDHGGAVLHGARLPYHLAAPGTDVLAGLVGVRHRQGDVAVGGAQLVALHAPVVGQLQHLGVEIQRALQVADPEHGMENAHRRAPIRRAARPRRAG